MSIALPERRTYTPHSKSYMVFVSALSESVGFAPQPHKARFFLSLTSPQELSSLDFPLKGVCRYGYTEHCWDEISPLVALCSLAIMVWEAELMTLNIVLLLILSHAAYIIVRWYIDGYKEARGLC